MPAPWGGQWHGRGRPAEGLGLPLTVLHVSQHLGAGEALDAGDLHTSRDACLLLYRVSGGCPGGFGSPTIWQGSLVPAAVMACEAAHLVEEVAAFISLDVISGSLESGPLLALPRRQGPEPPAGCRFPDLQGAVP